MTITFQILEQVATVNHDELCDKIYIAAFLNQEPAGFVRIQYINQDVYEKKLLTPLDYFIYKVYQGQAEIQSAYEKNDWKTLVNKLSSIGSTEEGIKQYIQDNYVKQHAEFVDYWVNKPNREMTYVLTELDTHMQVVANGELVRQDILPRNYRGLGIGKALLEKSMEYIHDKGLNLWQSKTQTTQGQKFWKVNFDNFQIFTSGSLTKQFSNSRAFSVKS